MSVVNVTAQQLSELLASAQPPLLLDCREKKEWDYCRIDGARHIPMSEFRERFTELDSQDPIVVYCHHGMRSQAVAEFLVRQGYAQVANLAGGIDAWSLQVDAGVPRY